MLPSHSSAVATRNWNRCVLISDFLVAGVRWVPPPRAPAKAWRTRQTRNVCVAGERALSPHPVYYMAGAGTSIHIPPYRQLFGFFLSRIVSGIFQYSILHATIHGHADLTFFAERGRLTFPPCGIARLREVDSEQCGTPAFKISQSRWQPTGIQDAPQGVSWSQLVRVVGFMPFLVLRYRSLRRSYAAHDAAKPIPVCFGGDCIQSLIL